MKMEEKQREAIALKKFSIISPVLNGQVAANIDYFRETAAHPIDMPHLGVRKYSVKTFEAWLYRYRRYGFDGLVNDHRSDRGKRRKITAETGDKITEARKSAPNMPITVLYEKLISEGIIDPTEISRPTIYRFVEDMNLQGAFKDDSAQKECRRFSHDKVGDLYQADVLYGPHVKINGKKQTAYLHMIIDDCSRYPMYSQFYSSQNFETLRHCFKEAVMRRGVPRLMYTDNGKIYRSQQFEFICASLGCTLLHSQPFVPQGRGKVERYFKTVRERFLSKIDAGDTLDLERLNMLYFKWLEEDYTRKAHGGLGSLSPHDVLMSQVSNLKLISDRTLLDEIFLYRVSRKIGHDATVQIRNILYETDPAFAGKRTEIRYDPEWLGDETKELPIFFEGKKIGVAKPVRFHDNAHAKRKFPGNRKKPKDNEGTKTQNTISFLDMTENNHV
jgi:transposase InsO family protein